MHRVPPRVPAACLAVMLACYAPFCLRAQDTWPMKAHDARRTGQSPGYGALAVDPAQSWSAEAPAAYEVNIGATVTRDGVFFGSWGLLRDDPEGRDARFWDKGDGKLYGLDQATGIPLWGTPLDLDRTAQCYELAGRPWTLTDLTFSCTQLTWHVTFYNGTVEGQPAYDAARNILYVGRGDGKLYAVDPDAGRILWRYATFNPEDPGDPDGGGEVVTAPLLGPDGSIYFGTWGEGPYETNAIYAINPDSTLQWRYPAAHSLDHRLFASPALSPDEATLYFSGWTDDDLERPASVYALHRAPTTATPDQERLKWTFDLTYDGLPVWTSTLAVGSDGTIYIGGLFTEEGANVPILFALEDHGAEAALKWPPIALRDGAQLVLGLALREVDGQTVRLYATTSNSGTLFFNWKEEGSLFAIDPATGTVLASYDPSDDVPEAVGGLNSPAIGADGVIYFGVRGHFVGPFAPEPADGHVFAVRYDAEAARFSRVWSEPVAGHVEWNHPAIGPDGGIYIGTSVGNGTTDTLYTRRYAPGTIPEGTTPLFYAFKGPTLPLAAEAAGEPPQRMAMEPPYPNPFSDVAGIPYRLPRPARVRIQVIDPLGRTVQTLVDAHKPAGRYQAHWDGTDGRGRRAANGVYLLLIRAQWDGALHRATQRLVLQR